MLDSRAVTRQIDPGNEAVCAYGPCSGRVKFQAKKKNRQVIANVYADGRWDRTDHYHEECYEEAGRPYGKSDDSSPRTRAGFSVGSQKAS